MIDTAVSTREAKISSSANRNHMWLSIYSTTSMIYLHFLQKLMILEGHDRKTQGEKCHLVLPLFAAKMT